MNGSLPNTMRAVQPYCGRCVEAREARSGRRLDGRLKRRFEAFEPLSSPRTREATFRSRVSEFGMYISAALPPLTRPPERRIFVDGAGNT